MLKFWLKRSRFASGKVPRSCPSSHPAVRCLHAVLAAFAVVPLGHEYRLAVGTAEGEVGFLLLQRDFALQERT
jgi:hypothetical protein